MPKQTLLTWLNENLHQIGDFFLFVLVVIVGTLIKIYKAMENGTKASMKWFIAELLISFFIAITVYAVFDQFFQLNKLFTYMISAWSGSFSTTFHKKFEELIGSIFDSLKLWINKKLGV